MYDQIKQNDGIVKQSKKKSSAELNPSSQNSALKQADGKNAAKLTALADSYIDKKHPLQKKANPKGIEKTNNTGLPDKLKSGIENLSGYSMDDVKVHYNSSKPAQLQAHAYAQGNQIHLSAGQEKHLPHEAWHVVQQKQGRVRPTFQLKENVAVNDNKSLEKEADVMGKRANSSSLHTQPSVNQIETNESGNTIQPKWIQESDSLLRWNGLLQGVQWYEIIDGVEKGKMYYKVVNPRVIPPDHLASYLENQKKPMQRDFYLENSEFGDLYGQLDSQVISEEEARVTAPESSLTEAFLHKYSEQLTEITSKVAEMKGIITRVIAAEKQYSSTHFVFYHAMSKTSRLMVEYNKAKGGYERDYQNIMQYFRTPDFFVSESRPNTVEDATKSLSEKAGDHGSIRSHIISLSTSLFSNFEDIGESTLNFFMQNINISTPWKDQLAEKLKGPKFGKWWKAFGQIEDAEGQSGDLVQIIIPKDIAEQIVLATTAGGTPAQMPISSAINIGPEKVTTSKGEEEHLQGRLLLTSDITKKVMDEIITNVYSFGELSGLDEKIQKMVKAIPSK